MQLETSTSQPSSEEKTVSQSNSRLDAHNVQPKAALKTSIFWRMWMAEVHKMDFCEGGDKQFFNHPFSVGNVLSIFLLLLIPKELRHALYFG